MEEEEWIKLHLAIDARSQEIVGAVTTSSEATVTPLLMDQTGSSVKRVMADGGYDGRSARDHIAARGAEALIPPCRNARYRGDRGDRDRHLSLIRGLGNDEQARSIWGKLTGYHRRVLVESTFSALKRLFGDRLFSRTFKGHILENQLRVQMDNNMLKAS